MVGDHFCVGQLRPGLHSATLSVGRFDGEEEVTFDLEVPAEGLEGLVLDVDALCEARDGEPSQAGL